MNKKNFTGNRWALVNKNTSNVRTIKATRSAARSAKRSTERLFDLATETFVR